MAETGAKKKLVLVVDDDENLNELLCLTLADAGFETVSAYDGRQALDMARSMLPDIVLLDIMLPDIDGRSICKDLSENASTISIPVIIMSSLNDVSSRISAFVSGAKRYLIKTCELPDVVLEIKRTLEQRRLSEAIFCSHECL